MWFPNRRTKNKVIHTRNLCNILYISIFNKPIYLSNDSQSYKTRTHAYFYKIPYKRSFFNLPMQSFYLK